MPLSDIKSKDGIPLPSPSPPYSLPSLPVPSSPSSFARLLFINYHQGLKQEAVLERGDTLVLVPFWWDGDERR